MRFSSGQSPAAPAKGAGSQATSPPPQVTNIQTIIALERETLQRRSALERVTDAVSRLAVSPIFVVAHVLWFFVWIGVNSLGRATFDPYPFNLLALVVSLEAIVLTGFVLTAQRRMTQQADRRAHLELQINLLAEQELTAILKMQCLLAEQAGIDLTGIDPRLDQLRSHTDVQQLAATIATEMASADGSTTSEQPAVGDDSARVETA